MASPRASEITRPTHWDLLIPLCTIAMATVAAIAAGPEVGVPLMLSVLLLVVSWLLIARDLFHWHAVALHTMQKAADLDAELEASFVDGDDA